MYDKIVIVNYIVHYSYDLVTNKFSLPFKPKCSLSNKNLKYGTIVIARSADQSK